MSRVEVNSYICKLRLLQYGLLEAAEDLDKMRLRESKVSTASAAAGNGEDNQAESEEDDPDNFIEKRNAFVRKSIRKARISKYASLKDKRTVLVAEKRRAVLKEFLHAINKTSKCANCQAITAGYRKDRYSKIFKKPLTGKARSQMIQTGQKEADPLLLQAQAKLAAKKDDQLVDEGIVADFEDVTPDEDDEQDVEMLDVEEQLANGSVVAIDVAVARAKKAHFDDPQQEYMTSSQVYASLTYLFQKEQELFDLVYSSRPIREEGSHVSADIFFIKDVIVPPNKYRPINRTGDGGVTEAQQNSLFKNILSQCDSIDQIGAELKGTVGQNTTRQRTFADFQNAGVRLQDAVNSLLDSERNPSSSAGGRQTDEGIKQLLEKKEGLFRKHMMGKRVNFAARSVISPDPNIETNEIGIPPVFAKKLTYPEPVTQHNFYDLKEAVLNGVDKWPGAAAVENENGQVINLRTKNVEERQALANQLLAPSSIHVSGARNKKVHRHLNNGDIVLMNRQPTLHKPSFMGHRARVLPGEKTIRMHYANCNTYNADFDGDEMNMHFPQNEIARAEALQIADTDHQYLVATSGKPLRGLIQDHISMGVWLTNRDTFFGRGDYNELLYSCLRPEDGHITSERIVTIAPAVIKPHPKWTGKQVISTVLKNITPESKDGLTLQGKTSDYGDRWGRNSEEKTVIFDKGELLCGILDKAQLGPSGGGFIHSIHEIYGHTVAGKLLSILGRLLTRFLNMRAFTCGMDDLRLTVKGNNARKEKLKSAETVGHEVAMKYVTLDTGDVRNKDSELRSRLEDVLRDDEKQKNLDQVMNAQTARLSTEISKTCLPAGLAKPFPKNQMQAMTTSGAKGSGVNANLISCNLGQQVLEGRRVPVMISGKTLPCFKPFETNVMAGGYVSGRFLTGIRPQEYYFHAMAGREGLIDTAVKTSRSGYLQRCLIKGMEGLKAEYDSSVRDSDGSMVQFLYGEDALDITKQKHLTDFKFLAENYLSVMSQVNLRDEFSRLANDEAGEWNKAAMKKVRKTRRTDAMDPALAHFNPGATVGATSESFAAALKKYCDDNPDKRLKDKKKGIEGDLSKKTFTALMDMKYMKSVVDPGEAVGIVAGQSVGEPSTQMTLNTFHLAGHAAKNVTLGIPRLREIVMTASSKIMTPQMSLYLNPELSEYEGQRFAKAISKLALAEVVDTVRVSERISEGKAFPQAKIYEINLDLYPAEEYCEEYAIQIDDILTTFEHRFIPRLIKNTRAETRKKRSEKSLSATSAARPQVGKSSGVVRDEPAQDEGDREGGSSDSDDGGDDDATNNKQRQNRREAVSYAEPDEDEEALVNQARRESSPNPDPDDLLDEGIGGSPQPSEASDSDSSTTSRTSAKNPKKQDAKELESRIKTRHEDVTRFRFSPSSAQLTLEFDATSPKLLMLQLVEDACRHAVIQSIPGLASCVLTEEKSRDSSTGDETTLPVVVTEGVNLVAMRDYQDILNPHKLFTNDIAAMLSLYGVEACRATIVREIDAVFKGHSISVDNRHLNLIADMMTRGGGFNPFNRNGLRQSVSPFMKMSFETTVGFLKDAVLEGDWDDLKNPSARIVMGRIGTVGTGAFDVLMPLNHDEGLRQGKVEEGGNAMED